MSTTRNHPKGKHICGVGATLEGIGTNPLDYDLTYDMAWKTNIVNVKEWVADYTLYRYGVKNDEAEKALQLLAQTVYNCPSASDGPQESFLCARPSLKIEYVSTWGTAQLYYNPQLLLKAWTFLLNANQQLESIDTYRYDVVDLTRQVLADYGKRVHAQIVQTYEAKDRTGFDFYTAKFLQLIKDQERLLGTRKEFLTGEWIRQASSCGFTPEEKEQYVRNAKRQICTWASVDSSLHEYAHKEWNGILSTLYEPRWNLFFNELRNRMSGKEEKEIDFFTMKTDWVNKTESLIVIPLGDEIIIAQEIYKRYLAEIER